MFFKDQPNTPVGAKLRSAWSGGNFLVIDDTTDTVIFEIDSNNTVVKARLPAGAITENDIATDAVSDAKIQDSAIRTRHLTNYNVTPVKTFGVPILYDLGAPDLGDDDAVVVSEVADTNKVYTLTAAPYVADVPRNITIKRTVSVAPDTIGDITVTGTNYDDTVITEVFTVGADGVVVEGTKAFKTVTEVKGSTYTLDDTADTIEVGIGNLIGCHFPANDVDDIMLAVFGTDIITLDGVAISTPITTEGTTVDANTSTYDGTTHLLIFQKNST